MTPKLSEPVGPVVLDERGDTYVFRSIRDLVGYVEAIDVRDGIFEAFDAADRPILLAAASDRSPVTYSLGSAADPERLRGILVRYARHPRIAATLPSSLVVEDASLENLLAALSPREQPSPRRNAG